MAVIQKTVDQEKPQSPSPSRRTDKSRPPVEATSPYLNRPILKERVYRVFIKVNGHAPRAVDCYQSTTLQQAVESAIRGVKLSRGIQYDTRTVHHIQKTSGPRILQGPVLLSTSPIVGTTYSVKVDKLPKGSPSSIGRAAVEALAVG